MDVQVMPCSKLVCVEDSVSRAKGGSYLYTYGTSAEPMTFLSSLNLRKGHTMVSVNTAPRGSSLSDAHPDFREQLAEEARHY